MAILVDRDTAVICQGMTGRAGSFHTSQMIAYGTRVVAGVTPGKGGRSHLDRPVFDSVSEAKTKTGANASIVFVPPPRTADAILEAIAAKIPLIVCVTERVPLLDMARVRQALEGSGSRLVGPNSQGVLSPGLAQLGVMSTVDARPGSIGIVSRSASLTSEVVAQVTRAGLGQSTTVGVGGDPIHGLSLADCIEMFIADPETEGVIVLGEIGGAQEELAAATIARLNSAKPIVALVAGRHAPPRQRMGHAGALALIEGETAAAKIGALQAAGAHIAPDAASVGETMRRALIGKAALRRTA